MYAQTPPGFPIPVTQAIDNVVSLPEVPERQPPPEISEWKDYKLNQVKLTPKELFCTNLMLKGLTTKEMASVSGNTEKTLKHHIASIFKKFGVSSRAELFHEIFPT